MGSHDIGIWIEKKEAKGFTCQRLWQGMIFHNFIAVAEPRRNALTPFCLLAQISPQAAPGEEADCCVSNGELLDCEAQQGDP